MGNSSPNTGVGDLKGKTHTCAANARFIHPKTTFMRRKPKTDSKDMKDSKTVEQLGLELRRIRLESNLSQAEVAARSGVVRGTLMNLEAGRGATLLSFVRVLRALDRMALLDPFYQKAEPAPAVFIGRHRLQLKKQRKRASSGPGSRAKGN